MYSFVESDDRVAIVLKYIEEAVKELDEMDALVQSYKIHLNVSEVLCEIALCPPIITVRCGRYFVYTRAEQGSSSPNAESESITQGAGEPSGALRAAFGA
jgi:hypothetical protein